MYGDSFVELASLLLLVSLLVDLLTSPNAGNNDNNGENILVVEFSKGRLSMDPPDH